MAQITEDTIAVNLELACYQNYKAILEKLQQARLESGGKTQAQNLVRTFMLGVNSFFSCLSVRVYYGGWSYEHFENQKFFDFPLLSLEEGTLTGFVFQKKEPFFWQEGEACEPFQKEIEIYQKHQVALLQIYPILDVNQQVLGIIEVTSNLKNILSYQQELMELLIGQLGVLLETGQQSKAKPSHEKRPPSPELLDRLWRSEKEIEEAHEQEMLFYSLIRYFRDTIRLIEAWRHLQSLTPENEIGKYDFNRHADFYFEKAYKFSNLLLYSYKIRNQDCQIKAQSEDLVALIHRSISEFTREHHQSALNIRTQFPAEKTQAVVDVSLFYIAIIYALEHLFLQTHQTQENYCLVIVLKRLKTHTRVVIQTELDPLVKQLKVQDLAFDQYMETSLGDYGLEALFLPFAKLAVTRQGGRMSTGNNGKQGTAITIEFPKDLQFFHHEKKPQTSLKSKNSV